MIARAENVHGNIDSVSFMIKQGFGDENFARQDEEHRMRLVTFHQQQPILFEVLEDDRFNELSAEILKKFFSR